LREEDVKFKYSKYTGNPLDDLDLDDLIEKLSDLLLSSGFQSPYGGAYGESDDDRTMQALHDAIMDALFNGGVLSEDALEQLLGDPADADQADSRSKLEQLIQDIIDRMMQEGFITPAPDLDSVRRAARFTFFTRLVVGEAADAHVTERRAQLPSLERTVRVEAPLHVEREVVGVAVVHTVGIVVLTGLVVPVADATPTVASGPTRCS
jgi:hypothetical protein